ncbi:O-antigen polymerase [Thermosediminibacter oceani]|uniref:Oligosaccharide repeat unit polymerase n=1 Tax=Thermosediminibacter oceani (strain ATCC BAA-1034 / DSM 16646 / JW/IW-1228P) TaxID=555079 RepID=D9S1K6_THEOJ|nr:O-antigen polymerase [Thermosediminibacter oceani]ADL07283.1 hypothetical protein Toce_0507 [Thermosediminibacter oceani DSM 16646]
MNKRVSNNQKYFCYTKIFWLIFVFNLLAIILPLSFIINISEFRINSNGILTLFIIWYSSARLAILSAKGLKRLLSMTFWVFVYIWLGISPLFQVSVGRMPWPITTSEYHVTYALIISITGLLFYDVGMFLAGHLIKTNNTNYTPKLILDERKILLFAPISIVTAAVIIVAFFGGFDIFLLARAVRNAYLNELYSKSQLLLLDNLLRAIIFVSLQSVFVIWIRRTNNYLTKKNILKFIFLIVLIVLNLYINNPISTARYRFGFVVISLLFIGLKWNEKTSFPLWTLMMITFLLIIFPYADLFRNRADVSLKSLEFLPIYEHLVGNGDYDAFQQLSNTVAYVSKKGITWGKQLLGVIFFAIPRNLWPNKPLGSGEFIALNSGYYYTNLSCPLWAEAYLNGGFIAVIIIFTVYGILTKNIEHQYLSQQNGASFLDIFVPFFAPYQIFFLRGDLMSTFAYLIPNILFMLLVTKINCKR